MNLVLLSLSIICLFSGHYIKVLRWALLIKTYEEPKINNLLQSLAVGYFLNFLLPIRLGELCRAFVSGKKMRNGVSFSLATIIFDRYLDVLTVAGLFGVMWVFNFLPVTFLPTIVFYLLLSLFILLASFAAMKYSSVLKKVIGKIAGIFNPDIERDILFFGWSLITTFKDAVYKVSKLRLVVYTISMWFFYLVSYALMGILLSTGDKAIKFIDIFVMLFARGSVDTATIDAVRFNEFDVHSLPLLFAFLLVPIIILFVCGFFYNPKVINDETPGNRDVSRTLKLLPHYNRKDQLDFLENYFKDAQKVFLEKYLSLNRDVTILQDYSAGSNATTMLCMDEDRTFFRKYAFGDDAEKLYQQVIWLETYKERLPLPDILHKVYESGCCSYDMPYNVENTGFFGAIHSLPIEKSWTVLKDALETLDKKLYQPFLYEVNHDKIRQYIDNKVIKNLNKIVNSRLVSQLLGYDELIINGRACKNLNVLNRFFTYEHLSEVFSDDCNSVIHGDLTIENIIFSQTRSDSMDCSHMFYLIDPNTGNLHESPFLDYAKILQSLHGGYEFLMKTEQIAVENNRLDFFFTKSEAYSELYNLLLDYLNEKFSPSQIKSIFYHEIIHWLRLLPYKLEKNGKRALLFYAGFILVANDIIDKYEIEV